MVSILTKQRPGYGLLSIVLVVLSLWATPASSWTSHASLNPRSIPITTGRSAATSPLFVPQQQQPSSFYKRGSSGSRLYSSEKEESGEELEESTSASSDESAKNESSALDEEDEKLGVMRTILLAGPLFVKFTIVLLIKFATDLIVFPLLWLYRLARLTKRRFLKMVGKGEREYPNGEPKP